MSALSLLRSPHDPRIPFPDTAFLRDLRMDDLIRLRGNRVGALELDLASFLSRDKTTLHLRAALFSELLEMPGLFDALQVSFSRLSDLYELQDARDGAMHEEQLLYSIREMEAYLEYLDGMRAIFTDYTVKSELLLGLWHALEPLCSGESYEALRAAVRKQSHAIKNIRSVTIGVNLDPALRPTEAGVIAINEEPYVSGETLAHLLRLQFKKSDFTCMTPLYPAARRFTPQEQAAMSESLNAALHKIFGDSLRSWASVIKSHVLGDLRVLAPLAEEWRFIEAAMDALRALKRQGVPLCLPDLIDEGAECITGLCHPLLARAAERPSAVVRNNVTFNETGRLYILTGPNSGGKSVYLQAVGMAYAMLHLGLPLPAERATMRPTDGIFTHFVDIRDGSYRHGRLGMECERIHSINRHLSDRSLVLFDEALSGTGATEAVAIATEILAAYVTLKVRGVWITHFHDLCRLPAVLDEGLANLSARLDTDSHERLYIVEPGDGEARSYAMDIAHSYHLTRDEILQASKPSP